MYQVLFSPDKSGYPWSFKTIYLYFYHCKGTEVIISCSKYQVTHVGPCQKLHDFQSKACDHLYLTPWAMTLGANQISHIGLHVNQSVNHVILLHVASHHGIDDDDDDDDDYYMYRPIYIYIFFFGGGPNVRFIGRSG